MLYLLNLFFIFLCMDQFYGSLFPSLNKTWTETFYLTILTSFSRSCDFSSRYSDFFFLLRDTNSQSWHFFRIVRYKLRNKVRIAFITILFSQNSAPLSLTKNESVCIILIWWKDKLIFYAFIWIPKMKIHKDKRIISEFTYYFKQINTLNCFMHLIN